MDLRAWITRQVDAAEEEARRQLVGRKVVIYPNDGSRAKIVVYPNDSGHAVGGTITRASRSVDGLELTVTGREAAPFDSRLAPLESEAAALRRCEADRRILARHTLDTSQTAFTAACEGCGTDEWGLPNTENLNDCPELLDLAHAHGLTDEVLAGLDRPEPPERPRIRNQLRLADILAIPSYTPMSDVPEALRGPRWGSRA
ncbi:hypothetical protein ACH4GK_31800 [Streptomyces rimosus]|uniref:hypothetical protein n=1 Tax=Streptomyces rimosus TaxID=1927 RepID=UPI0004CBA47F|nr:hypothetical protein [Streptomyces rimosus]